MFQNQPNKAEPPKESLADLRNSADLELSLVSHSPEELASQFEAKDVADVVNLHIIGGESREQVNELLTKLPPFGKVEWIRFDPALVSDLKQYEMAWFGNVRPTEDPVRFALAATLLDRNRFPALQWVSAGDGGWKVKDGLLDNPYRTYEPGIDFV